MLDIRCTTCCRKLAEAQGFTLLSIKCPRCGLINTLSAQSSPTSERRRASLSENGNDRIHHKAHL